MAETPDLSDKFLMESAGWPVFKQAKTLREGGQVLEARQDGTVYRGRVVTGQAVFKTGLDIRSRVNVKNLCTCRENRQKGVICAHAVAVCLQVLHGPPKSQKAERKKPAAPQEPVLPEIRPRFVTDPVIIEEEGLETVSLQIILPPQERLPDLFQRDSLVLTLETRVGDSPKPRPLTSLPKSSRFGCSSDDFAILTHIWELAEGQLPPAVNLTGERFLALAEHFRQSTQLNAARKQDLRFDPDPLPVTLEIRRLEDGGFRINSRLGNSGSPRGDILLSSKSALFLGQDGSLRPLVPGLPAAYLGVLREPVLLPEDAALRFLATELPRLEEFFFIDRSQEAEGSFRIEPAQPRVAFSFEGSLNFLEGHLRFDYPDREIEGEPVRDPEPFSMVSPNDPHLLLLRNTEFEEQCWNRLRTAGFTWDEKRRAWTLKGEREILTFFAASLPKLEADAEWEVEAGARFGRVTEKVEVIEPEFEVRQAGENWLEFDYQMTTGSGETFRRDDILRMLETGRNSTRRDDGSIAVFDPSLLSDFHEVLQDIQPRQQSDGSFRIDAAQGAFLRESLPAGHVRVDDSAAATWRLWERDPRGPRRPELPEIGDLAETLRDYQRTGVAWLWFLARQNLGGILADDMGLGKTLQTLALLRALKAQGTVAPPFLVVCPSSLVGNWQSEAGRFTPELSTLVLTGPDRKKHFEKVTDTDIVITSYALLRRDAKVHARAQFGAAVLDEAQHIKNPETQNAQAAFNLRAARRFVLTGTPLENTVRDLWSIMNFVMPGYLGEREEFRQRYELPLSSQEGGDPSVRNRLRRRLKPFMLRRRKDDVLDDLPPKIEQTLYCDLSPAQSDLYTQILQESRRRVSEAAGQKNKGKQRMILLTALLRLRQACCDPRLLTKGQADAEPDTEEREKDARATSAKRALLGEVLDEALDGGHRLLVFSQFSTMLRLLAEDLDEREVSYCYLDGSTRNRQEVIDGFRAADGPPVFLLSLKAGGVGLNLSAADTVVHFDPWWNPAVEAQATDRAHRIGQRRTVTAYKLITRGTIEEKILALQNRKRQAIDAIVESDEPLMQGLSLEEIEELLAE